MVGRSVGLEEPQDKVAAPGYKGHLPGRQWYYTEVTPKEKRQYGRTLGLKRTGVNFSLPYSILLLAKLSRKIVNKIP